MGYPSSPDAFFEKFTGQARDPETANVNSMTGLDWMRARYYSSSQGRFQSVDPANAGAMVGDPQSWNGYAYVGNNPLNYRDPSGTIGLAATTIGAATGNPIGVAVGLGVDVFCAFFCGKLFGGSPSLPAPKITGNGPEVWSERAPISGGGVNTGGVYGGGCGANGICSFQTSMGGMAGLETEWWRIINRIESYFAFKRTDCSEQVLKNQLGTFVGGKAVPFMSYFTLKDDWQEFTISAGEAGLLNWDQRIS